MRKLNKTQIVILTLIVILLCLAWIFNAVIIRLLGIDISQDVALELALSLRSPEHCMLINVPGVQAVSPWGLTKPTTVQAEHYECILSYVNQTSQPKACLLLTSQGEATSGQTFRDNDSDVCLLYYVWLRSEEAACEYVSEEARPACEYLLACEKAAAVVAKQKQIDRWYSCALREYQSSENIIQLVHFTYHNATPSYPLHMCAVIDNGTVYTKEQAVSLGYPEDVWQTLPTSAFLRDENELYAGTDLQITDERDTKFRHCE
jgi:hypothetical protein